MNTKKQRNSVRTLNIAGAISAFPTILFWVLAVVFQEGDTVLLLGSLSLQDEVANVVSALVLVLFPSLSTFFGIVGWKLARDKKIRETCSILIASLGLLLTAASIIAIFFDE